MHNTRSGKLSKAEEIEIKNRNILQKSLGRHIVKSLEMETIPQSSSNEVIPMTDRENDEYRIDEWTTYVCDSLKAHCDFYDRSETYRMVDTIDYDDHTEAERLCVLYAKELTKPQRVYTGVEPRRYAV
jgi:hypothetical protein